MSNKSNARRNRQSHYQSKIAEAHKHNFNQIIIIYGNGNYAKEWYTYENGKRIRNGYL